MTEFVLVIVAMLFLLIFTAPAIKMMDWMGGWKIWSKEWAQVLGLFLWTLFLVLVVFVTYKALERTEAWMGGGNSPHSKQHEGRH